LSETFGAELREGEGGNWCREKS